MLEGQLLGDRVYGEQDSTTQVSGYAANASGSTVTTTTSVLSGDPNDGTVSVVGYDSLITPGPISGTYTSGPYLSDGTNVLPSGGTVVVNTAANQATGTITVNGVQWNVGGTADADGVNIDFTVTNSVGGSYAFKQPLSLYTPTAGSTTSSVVRGAAAERQPKDAARVAIVAGGVAATMGMIAAVAAVIPGGQVAAATAGICAAAATVVAAGAAIVAYNEDQEKKQQKQ